MLHSTNEMSALHWTPQHEADLQVCRILLVIITTTGAWWQCSLRGLHCPETRGAETGTTRIGARVLYYGKCPRTMSVTTLHPGSELRVGQAQWKAWEQSSRLRVVHSHSHNAAVRRKGHSAIRQKGLRSHSCEMTKSNKVAREITSAWSAWQHESEL